MSSKETSVQAKGQKDNRHLKWMFAKEEKPFTTPCQVNNSVEEADMSLENTVYNLSAIK